jgi:hypothetical protein
MCGIFYKMRGNVQKKPGIFMKSGPVYTKSHSNARASGVLRGAREF